MHAELHATSQHGDFHPIDNIIPQMTAFFIDCFTVGNMQKSFTAPAPSLAKMVRSSVSTAAADDIIKGIDFRPRNKVVPQGRTAKSENQVTIRTLVQFISHHFNNILMGIWGNASLMRMELPPNHPVQPNIEQTESLIQDGAFFIHLILGYLAERRVLAKRLRLNQLVGEITLHVPDDGVRKELVRQLQINEALRRPRAIAGSTARILDHLLSGIETLCRGIDTGIDDHPKMKGRTTKIAELIGKGRKMTTLLHYYTGLKTGMKRYSNFYRMLEQTCRRVRTDHPGISSIQLQVPQDLLVYTDRIQIEWLLETVLDTVCRNGQEEGRLAITVRPVTANFTKEMEHTAATGELLEICFTKTSILSNGKRATRGRKSFSGGNVRDQECVMRLAAVSRVLKVHGGYLGDRDFSADGSSTNIYLPSRKLKRAILKICEPTHCVAV
jgi:hypothetical protein